MFDTGVGDEDRGCQNSDLDHRPGQALSFSERHPGSLYLSVVSRCACLKKKVCPKYVNGHGKVKVISWPIGLYRHPPTKTGRSRPYPNRFSSGLEGGQFMKPFFGWYTFKFWDR